MPRINLLPWRAERLKEQQKAFGVATLMVVAFAGVLVYGAMQAVNGMIEHQRARNAYLQAEIKALDARIAEIRELEQRKAALLARMNIIEQLQTSRPEIVHLFDELVRTIPEGVHLSSLSQNGAALPRIVTLHDIRIAPAREAGGLTMNLTAKTYRYLDESQAPARRPAAQGGR